MLDLLTSLNPAQRQAAETLEGPVLILAGAGSGKTKALTHRFAYLLQQGVSPMQILCVTFTNKAANEMQERVNRLLGQPPEVRYPWLGTFHRVCIQLLRRELDQADLGRTGRFSIWDDADQLQAIKRIYSELNLDAKRFAPKAVLGAISSSKNERVLAAEYEQFALGPFQAAVAQVYRRYETLLAESNAVDFDDILLLALQLFERHPEVLARYQERFRYLMVDEYQDTNRVQYLLVKLLASQHRNLFVIGDDWQSVYSWRGADFRNILDFKRDYPEATVIKLEQNYRSTQTILDAAQAVISRNTDRSDKQLWTEAGQGVPVTVVRCRNELDEAEFVVREVLGLVRAVHLTGVGSLSDCVVLYRTNAQSRSLEEAFLKAGVPYRMVGGVQFYERKEVKDVLAYLRFLNNPRDWVSFERIVNVPTRGIGPKTVEGLRGLDLSQPDGWVPKVQPFFDLTTQLRTHAGEAPARLTERVVAASGYQRFLQDGTLEGETRWENVQELIGAMEGYETLEEFLENAALEPVKDRAKGDPEGQITLMTMHAAKGLEFPVVFVAGMEEGIFPGNRALEDKAALEEERRLAYVAMTRARDRLYLMYAEERRLYGALQANPYSRFIREIPEELTSWV